MNDEQIAKLYDQALVIESNGDYVAGELDPVKFAKLVAEQKREWVGLTYEDMIEVWNKLYKERTDVMPLPTTFAKAIEAKLKEKNNG